MFLKQETKVAEKKQEALGSMWQHHWQKHGFGAHGEPDGPDY